MCVCRSITSLPTAVVPVALLVSELGWLAPSPAGSQEVEGLRRGTGTERRRIMRPLLAVAVLLVLLQMQQTVGMKPVFL